MTGTSPCYLCRKREQGCHDHCMSYRQWKAEHDRREAEARAYR